MKDDFKLLRGFVTDGQTNEQTFVNVELLSWPKKLQKYKHHQAIKLSSVIIIKKMFICILRVGIGEQWWS